MATVDMKARIEQAKQEARSLKDSISQIRAQKGDGEMSDCYQNSKALGDMLECRRRLKGHHGKVYSMHWSGDSNHLVSVSQDGKLIVWSGFTTNKVQAFSLASAWIMACGFEQSRSMHVACGGLDNVASIYQLGQPQSTKERAATVSESGSTARKSRPAKELIGHDGYISCCRFVDEQKIITSSGDSTCILWDTERGEVMVRFTDHGADVMRVSISPVDKNIFVSGSCDCTAKLWDIRSGKCTQTFQGHEGDLMSVAFFPDGQAFGTASEDSSCRLFDIRACSEINKYENDDILCGVTSVSFSKSGRLLFAGYDDCQCRVWDTLSSSGNHLWELVDERVQPNASAHEDRISCLDVNPNGDALCTGSWDSVLKIWA